MSYHTCQSHNILKNCEHFFFNLYYKLKLKTLRTPIHTEIRLITKTRMEYQKHNGICIGL